MKEQVRIGIIGLGVVGSGVCEILAEQRDNIHERTGIDLVITKALASPTEDKSAVAQQYGFQMVQELSELLADSTIDIIIELIGKIHPAKEFIEASLKSGKHVVTANKDLLATHGEELAKIAEENHVSLFYEASVAGGIPILRTLRNNYLADDITSISGIVNGTTNYMLTKMLEENISYERALKEAQEKGFAESDPTNDVQGIDAAYKMVILTKFAYGMTIAPENVLRKGITDLKTEDIDLARELGYEIKLIGNARKMENGQVDVSVAPLLVSGEHPLASIKNEYNGVFIESKGIGRSMFYGPGAGSRPTATSVVSDLVAIGENKKNGLVSNFIDFDQPTQLADPKQIFNRYYISFPEEEEIEIRAWDDEKKLVTKHGKTAFITKPVKAKEIEKILIGIIHEENVSIIRVMEG